MNSRAPWLSTPSIPRLIALREATKKKSPFIIETMHITAQKAHFFMQFHLISES